MGAWAESWRIFRRCLKDAEFRDQVGAFDQKGEEELARAGAARLLARFQEEGRLVDFLTERIDDYDDAQVGSAVRSIHASCRAVLRETFELEPVLAGREGETVTVSEGFDPLSIRLEGDVGATPPFRGILRHPGWRVRAATFAPVSPGRSPDLIAPAEVEVR